MLTTILTGPWDFTHSLWVGGRFDGFRLGKFIGLQEAGTRQWAQSVWEMPAIGPAAIGISGTAGPDLLVSGIESDSLAGLGGNDTLIGSGGNDTLNGGGGLDSMAGGTGNDLYLVDSPSDIVVEGLNEGIDTVRFTGFNFVLPANVENMISNAPYGGLMVGNDLNNVMTGSRHNDWIVGAGGADRMKGGLGNDIYFVESRGDLVIENANAGWDAVYTDLRSYVLPSNVEELQGIAATGMRLTGNDLDNWISGDRGDDTLVGGAGRDGFAGLGGNDQLSGGTGTDFFQFWSPLGPGNVDTITDFDPLGEEFDLWRNGDGMFSALANTGYLDSWAFKVIGPGGSAVDSNDRILYNQSLGKLYYDADGSGAGAMVEFAILSNQPVLTATNFWVFDT
jgi:Ca2+-binding RTX toxin-like protein